MMIVITIRVRSALPRRVFTKHLSEIVSRQPYEF